MEKFVSKVNTTLFGTKLFRDEILARKFVSDSIFFNRDRLFSVRNLSLIFKKLKLVFKII